MKQLVTYLNFDGTCHEAMKFYAKNFGAELQVHTFGEMPPDFPCPEDAKNRVMHASLTKDGVTLMASDAPPGMPIQMGNNVWVNVVCESMDEIKRLFAAFSEGGEVVMDLQDQFWGAHFGMLRDKFGTQWMFNYELPKKA
ncbi:MAG TPA: VOC family protein [Bryobacteraceae bacterium]|nr:VOC family protein [Bryobacteraceae bacterium]